jgi:hypothetical protein
MRRSRAVEWAPAHVSLADTIAHLRGLDLNGLRARWRTVMGRAAPHHLPRHLLFAIIAYRVQAELFGDLDAQTSRFLKSLGGDQSDGEVKRLTEALDRGRRELVPGTVLAREWNGHSHRVMVTRDGFSWEGRTYDSLSRIALAITGTRWNGPRFFGLRDRRPREATP